MCPRSRQSRGQGISWTLAPTVLDSVTPSVVLLGYRLLLCPRLEHIQGRIHVADIAGDGIERIAHDPVRDARPVGDAGRGKIPRRPQSVVDCPGGEITGRDEPGQSDPDVRAKSAVVE